jgi:Ca2+-dependent lipid-binding protein
MVESYVVMYQNESREGTKKKTGVVKGSLRPVWNKSIQIDGCMLTEDKVIYVELKKPTNHVHLGKNKTWGGFELNVEKCMNLTNSHRGRHHDFVLLGGDAIQGTVTLGFDLYPALPPLTEESLNHARNKSMLSRSSSIQPTVFDAPYLTVNTTRSCLLFDAGLEGIKVQYEHGESDNNGDNDSVSMRKRRS